MSFKFKMHSATDLITNSSTTIYTYSGSSPNACKEMINAFFSAFGINLTCDDAFTLLVIMNDSYHYENWLNSSGCDVDGDVDAFISKVENGEVEKPKWMFEAENYCEREGTGTGTSLCIIAKKPEYEDLAQKIGKFLYSTHAEESSN